MVSIYCRLYLYKTLGAITLISIILSENEQRPTTTDLHTVVDNVVNMLTAAQALGKLHLCRFFHDDSLKGKFSLFIFLLN